MKRGFGSKEEIKEKNECEDDLMKLGLRLNTQGDRRQKKNTLITHCCLVTTFSGYRLGGKFPFTVKRKNQVNYCAECMSWWVVI